MEFSVLGPLEVRDGQGRVVDLGGPRQRSVLARLLVAGGTVVPAERIVDDLWRGEPPPRALGALQAYVSHLRRVVEPDRAPRTPARLLVSVPPGYALRADPGALDAAAFTSELEAAADAEPARALELLDRALGRWRGPAYVEVAEEPWAQPEAVRLDELRVHARERRVATLLAIGRPAAAVADLEALLLEHRLREESWRLLVLALYRAGRQGDALAALQRARAVLADELGLDPGPGLRELERAVLAHDPALLEEEPATTEAPPALPAAEPTPPHADQDVVVGRDAELRRLVAFAAGVAASARPSAAVVAGEPGIGKTALATRLAATLEADGWRVAWGRCPETEGSPALWPWVEVLDSLGELPPQPAEEAALAPMRGGERERTEDEPSARFRQHRALAAYLRRLAGRQPLALVLDDLHRADDGTLVALRDLLADPAPGRLLVVATYRPTEVGEELGETLAALARRDALRVELTGLGPAEVEELVRVVCAEEGLAEPADLLATPDVAARIAERSAGNPFYVRETARLLAREGALVAVEEVPAGVRDVVRRRLARLPEPARLVLRTAAVAGREVDLGVLVAADERAEDEVYDAVEVALLAGLLEEPGTGRVRFAHALVRDTVYDDLPRLRRERIHARVARALEEQEPDDLAGLAHHWVEAGAGGDPARAVHHATAAAEQAEQRLAYRASLTQRERAVDAYRLFRRPDPAPEVELLAGLARAQQLAGRAVSARGTRGEALRRARDLDDPVLAARALTAIDVPLLWSNRGYGEYDADLVAQAEEIAARLRSADSELRVRVLAAWATEMPAWTTTEAAQAVVDEAIEVAERLDDPAVLAIALNAAYYCERRRGPGHDGGELAARIERLGAEHGMPGVEVLGLLGQLAGPCEYGRIDEAAELVERAEQLLRRYEMPIFSTIVRLFHAFREGVQGDVGRALEELADTAAPVPGMEMHDLAAIGLIGRACFLAQVGRAGEAAADIEVIAGPYPDQAAPFLALVAADEGRTDEARALLERAGPVPRDYLWLLLAGWRADAVHACGARDLAGPLYEDLLPYERLVHGGESHAMVLGPVATRLARLAELLGRHAEAEGHWRVAAEVAATARSERWAREAEDGLERVVGVTW